MVEAISDYSDHHTNVSGLNTAVPSRTSNVNHNHNSNGIHSPGSMQCHYLWTLVLIVLRITRTHVKILAISGGIDARRDRSD